MRERLVAWAEDCLVRGDVDLLEGRLSDQVNELELVTFFGATLESLEDGHEILIDELEVERRELHLIEVDGRRGDPGRRLRTIEESVSLQVGPYTVTGNLHRPPSAQPLAALSRWARFVPMTDVRFGMTARDPVERHVDVLLVNRERIGKSEPLSVVSVFSDRWPDEGTAASAG